MRNTIVLAGALAGALLFPASGYADGARRAGEAAGDAVGSIVGGAAGVAGAIVDGITGADEPRFREYVEHERVPDYRYDRDVSVGVELPPTVRFYEVPTEYHVAHYRYAKVNGRTVLVDPTTHRIVEIIE